MRLKLLYVAVVLMLLTGCSRQDEVDRSSRVKNLRVTIKYILISRMTSTTQYIFQMI